MSETTDFLKAVQHALRLEGIPEESIEHVINRLVYGDPHGLSAGRRASEQAQIHVNVTTPALTPELAQRVRVMSRLVQRGQLG